MSERDSSQGTLNSNWGKDPWEDHERLERLYVDEGLTQTEIAERFGVNDHKIFKELARAEITRDYSDVEIPDKSYPWRDKDLMRELYIEHSLATTDISIVLDCSQGTVCKWLDEHGLDRRTQGESMMIRHGTESHYNLSMDRKGYEVWYVGKDFVWHHRLLALMEYSLDEIRGKEVHHKNGCSFDNRVENLEPMDPAEHASHHKKIKGEERQKVADLYENTGRSSRDIGEEFGIANGTVLNIHAEFYKD